MALTAKNALIIGGTSGIGRTVAAAYVKAGANVIIAGRRAEGAEIADQMGARFQQMDASDEQSVADALAHLEVVVGKLDVLILNAGVGGGAPSLEETDTESLLHTFAVNTFGVFYGLKHAPKHMNDGAAIVVTGSRAGSTAAAPGQGDYAASKAAAAYLARTAAIELAPRNIRVNVVAPGSIADTGMMFEADDTSDDARLLKTLSAFGRFGRQDEACGLYLFLGDSEQSSFITGQEILLDGGAQTGITLPVAGAIIEGTR